MEYLIAWIILTRRRVFANILFVRLPPHLDATMEHALKRILCVTVFKTVQIIQVIEINFKIMK